NHQQGEFTTMQPVIDFLAEEELKAAEQIVMGIFEVKQVRQVRSAMDCKDAMKTRKEGKHVRVAGLSPATRTCLPSLRVFIASLQSIAERTCLTCFTSNIPITICSAAFNSSSAKKSMTGCIVVNSPCW